MLLLLAAMAMGSPARAMPLTAAAGGGIYIPWNRELREVYGSGARLTVGLAAPFSENRSRLRIEVGYATASGHQIREDPTFELGENRFWLVPLSMGLETNAHPSGDENAVRVWFGVHGILAFTGWDDPLLRDFQSPAMGGAIELRPELPVTREVAIWVSYRLSVLSEVNYRPGRGGSRFTYSGGTMQAGLAYNWR